MTIHPLPADAAPGRPALQERPDTTASPYDSTWTEQPASQPSRTLDRVMGQSGKIYVVLAVVLLVWVGLLALLYRTDRRIDRLERRLDRDISEDE
ncbi:MAG: CcmD family protein [Salinibacter sp.]|uniref:CcmD family protein n=1 Tax=Salinibacter sp. TaxID=2065818 RepID=UPI0035D470B7